MNLSPKTLRGLLICLATALASRAQTFTSLVSFEGSNGASPEYAMSLVQGTDGSLYGTTSTGGSRDQGTVFKITPDGTLTTVHNFTGLDGALPGAGLIQATNGNFYGTTEVGGAINYAYGTIYMLTPSGAVKTLHSFDSADGASPFDKLVEATDGSFYGTTGYGGVSNLGTIFRITAGGALTTLHSFHGTDGDGPVGPLLQATDGNFYGTTEYGGRAIPCSNGCGTVYRITAEGAFTTLYRFSGSPNAFNPFAGLVEAFNGEFYGTTPYGGTTGAGAIFRITPSGQFATVFNFNSANGDNAYPGLVVGSDGNLYGTTWAGGPAAIGTIYKVTPGGTLTTLHTFNGTDGYSPNGLLEATDGNFYGTTNRGGTSGIGTIFKLSVGLSPFVKTLPHAGKAGSAVRILGTDLTGASSVAFHGAAAEFRVVSPSEIAATVPAGATSGRIEVVTPRGTLASGGPFLVLP